MYPTLPLDPTATLGLLGALLALAVALLAAWRAEALRAARDPERHAWFGYAIRVRLLLVAAWFIGPAITALARPAEALAALLPAPIPAAGLLDLVALGVVPITVSLAAVIVSGDVERRLRGTAWTLRERLSRTVLGLVIALLPMTGLLAAIAALGAGQVRAALACALGGFVAALWLASLRAGALGLRPEAATAGPLRDRLFALAARARVRVRQVYVLSAERAKLANALAVRGGNVLLTDHLLARLSKREVDAVIAHELAHLRLGHPAKLGAAFAVPFAVCFVLMSLTSMERMAWLGTAPAFAIAGLVGWFSLLATSRRFERQADRGAVETTEDAPALVTALVRIGRLNDMPVDWGRSIAWAMTHPSVRRRALALAAAGHLGVPEAEALLAEPPDDPECWALPAGARERVFGTVAKRRRGAAASWGLVLASVVPPVVMLALLRWTGTQLARPLAFGLAAVVSFATALLAIDALAASAYAAWERALAARRVRGAGEGAFVGLAPGAGGMTYEGYADWDLGTLDLDPVALRYEGEQARFALERERIVSIQLVQGLPGWFPAPRVAVRWREASGAEHTFTVRDARARRLHQIAGLSRRLLDDLRRWHAQPAPAGVRPIDGGEPPREDSVTGTPHAELASPRTLIPALPLVLAMALLASLASGLSLASGAEPGALDVFGAALLTLAALRLPLWRAGRAMARQARRDASRAA